MEKRVLDRRLELMEAEGVHVPDRRERRRRRAGRRACAATSTPSCSPAAPTAPRDLPIPGRELTGIHFAMEYLTQQNRRCEGDDVPDARSSPPRASASSSSAAATPAPTASAPRIARARASVHQFELLPRPPDDARRRQSRGRTWPQHLPRVVRARGRRRARLLRVDAALHAATTTAASRRCTAVKVEMVARERPACSSSRSRQRVHAGRRPRAAGDGLCRARSAGDARPSWASKLTERGNVWRDANWMTSVARCLHGRRHAARPVADRLGDRRGAQRRARRRPVADGSVAVANRA